MRACENATLYSLIQNLFIKAKSQACVSEGGDITDQCLGGPVWREQAVPRGINSWGGGAGGRGSQAKGPTTQLHFEAKEGFLDVVTATVRLQGCIGINQVRRSLGKNVPGGGSAFAKAQG